MYPRREFVRALTIGGGISVAGCLNASDDGDEDDGEADDDEDENAEQRDEDENAEQRDDEPGRDESTPGTSDIGDQLIVGVLAPLPAKNPIGRSIANGARVAAQELNADGGVLGADVQIVVKDTREEPQTGRERYGELIREEEVDLTTGVFDDQVLLAIMDDIAASETVHLTTGARTPEASAMVAGDYDRYRYHFRPGPLNGTQLGIHTGQFAGDAFPEMGWDRVAVLAEDYEWATPVYEAALDRLERSEIEIVENNRYASGTEDFDPIYNDIEAADADAAFVVMAHTGTPALIQWAQQQRQFGFGGVHIPAQLPSYNEVIRGTANWAVSHNLATPGSELTASTQPFVDAYRSEFDEVPVYTGYTTYDAVMQYASVVERVGTTDPGEVITELEQSSHTGTYGTIEYHGKSHEFAHDAVYGPDGVTPVVQQWQPDGETGTQEVIYPDEFATAEYQSPEWL